MNKDLWEALLRGVNCPFDAPRPASNDHWDFVARLSVSSMYLAKDQTYRGRSLLIFDTRHASVPDQLSLDEWNAFCADLFRAQNVVSQTVRPDHLNIELLGNVVPHLHWHIVPRYLRDLRWGSPIWLTSLADMVETHFPAEDREELIRELRDTMSNQSRAS